MAEFRLVMEREECVADIDSKARPVFSRDLMGLYCRRCRQAVADSHIHSWESCNQGFILDHLCSEGCAIAYRESHAG